MTRTLVEQSAMIVMAGDGSSFEFVLTLLYYATGDANAAL